VVPADVGSESRAAASRGRGVPHARRARGRAADADPGARAAAPAGGRPREAIDWYWRPTNQVRAILEGLAEAGILGIARREGNLRVYDLVERLFPADLLATVLDPHAQRKHRLLSRYRGGGLLGTGGQAELWYGTGRTAAERSELREDLAAEGALAPVQVEGLKGERFVVADELPMVDAAEGELRAGGPPGGRDPGVAFLAPLDPLVWDRDLLRRLFDFDYVWEVYKPADQRQFGYYTLPILWGDRLVARFDPKLDRTTDTLVILGFWVEDPRLARDPAFAEALRLATTRFLAFLGVRRIDVAAVPQPGLRKALRAAVPRGRTTGPRGPDAAHGSHAAPARPRTTRA